MREAPSDLVRLRVYLRHDRREIDSRTVAAGMPTTLDAFMDDYVGHLEHHLRQVLGAAWDEAV